MNILRKRKWKPVKLLLSGITNLMSSKRMKDSYAATFIWTIFTIFAEIEEK